MSVYSNIYCVQNMILMYNEFVCGNIEKTRHSIIKNELYHGKMKRDVDNLLYAVISYRKDVKKIIEKHQLYYDMVELYLESVEKKGEKLLFSITRDLRNCGITDRCESMLLYCYFLIKISEMITESAVERINKILDPKKLSRKCVRCLGLSNIGERMTEFATKYTSDKEVKLSDDTHNKMKELLYALLDFDNLAKCAEKAKRYESNTNV